MDENAKRSRLAGHDLDELIRRVDNLPTLPSVVAKVNELVESPGSSAADINHAIRQDLVLSARILRLVNSPFYGFHRRIKSVAHAVVILGFSTVRNVVLSTFVLDSFAARDLPFGHREFWIHSLGTGAAAATLARRMGLAEAEDAFVAGLLHDVGKVVLHQYARDDFAVVARAAAERDCLLYDAELDMLGTSHAEIGGRLLDAWQLPEDLVEAVRSHHVPGEAGGYRDLVAVVHVADILARALLVGNGGDARIPRVNAEAWSRAGAPPEGIEAVLREIADELRKAKAFMDML